ncbi:MAG: sensor histidine kinase [Sandaracinaceae bacterium]
MKGLFSRVFVSVWVAMAALAATLLVIDHVQPEPEHRARRENLFAEAVRREGMEVWALARSAPDGEARAVARIRRFEDNTDAALFILRPDGTALGARPPSRSARQLAHIVRAGGNRRREKDSAYLIGFAMADGAVGVARVRRRIPWLERIGLTSLGAKLLAVFLLSGLLSWLLARMWIRPLQRLRQATRRLADGDLDTRVADDVRSAAELQTLAAEFDTMAERVQALVQGKERLLADVSHELNSPLARLRVALELARRKAGPDSASALDRIEREATRLGALVEGILASARAEAESRGPVELVGQLRQVVDDARFENAGVPVELDVAVATLHVEADRETLHRAVENVVRNAVAFSPEGGAVLVRLEERPGEVEIGVRDHGPGVPEDHLDAIFEPLFRVDPDRDRASGGTGLGLSITRRAVQAHGGRVSAENAPGGGLLVRLVLPR